MRYGADWADVFATSTEYNACVWVYHGFLFAIFLFKFEGAHVTEVYAFTAGYAFIVVYLWVPRYFVTRNSFILLLLTYFFP